MLRTGPGNQSHQNEAGRSRSQIGRCHCYKLEKSRNCSLNSFVFHCKMPLNCCVSVEAELTQKNAEYKQLEQCREAYFETNTASLKQTLIDREKEIQQLQNSNIVTARFTLKTKQRIRR